VFVDPDDGRRLILVQTRVRDDSTQASVAASLRNRLGQRGDDVVTEFSPSTRFAGRDVISYREAPASGSAIRWYVLVDHALQVSIGCQPGTGAEPVDVECEQAVRTAGIAPG
jgi:type VII secretion-associated protein (TIGR03931 family)